MSVCRVTQTFADVYAEHTINTSQNTPECDHFARNTSLRASNTRHVSEQNPDTLGDPVCECV